MLLIAYAINAARLGLANTAYFQARFILDKWLINPQSLNKENYQQAIQFSQRSLLLSPDNPHYLLSHAKIALWGFYAGFVRAEELNAYEKSYQKAIELRPNWPEAYADYAWFLSSVHNDEAKVWQNLQLAVSFGPFHGDTLETVIKVTLSRWSALKPEQKAQGYVWIARSLQTNVRDSVINLIKQAQKQFVVCYYLRRQANFSAELWTTINEQLCVE
jgi:Tfp pilus assembly protein PilF